AGGLPPRPNRPQPLDRIRPVRNSASATRRTGAWLIRRPAPPSSAPCDSRAAPAKHPGRSAVRLPEEPFVNLSYSVEYERFREEVRAFLAGHWTPQDAASGPDENSVAAMTGAHVRTD